MKKYLLGLGLMGLVSASAQAAIISGSPSASYSVGTDGSIAFTGSASASFIELTTTIAPKVKIPLAFSTSSTTPLVFELYVDLTSATGAYSYDDTKLVYSRTLSSGSGPVSLNFVPGKWIIKLLAQTPPFSSSVGTVPVPAAAWLFGSALVGVGALRRKQKQALAV